ncbi:MAG: hypothetical protein ACREOQ_17455 [Gemmatimonadales bacterium]
MADTALHALLAGAVDYAGLFPPAGLPMATAVAKYAEYRAGSDAWALGRFVVPTARLAELERAAEESATKAPIEPWRLSALVGANAAEDLRSLGEFNCRHAAPGAVALAADVIEAKAETVEAVKRLLAAVPRWAQAYVEVPLATDPRPLVDAIARHSGRAKMRTGGITPEAIPTAAQILHFIRACTDARVAFKATAGLHHPLRAEYRLTYEADSPHGTMFGYLNVFLTAVLLRQGLSAPDALALLEERSPAAFRVSQDAVEWRGHRADRQAIEVARREGIVAFGSCSFTEPVGEMRTIGPWQDPSLRSG